MAITHELQYSTTAASNTTLGSSITLDGTVMTPSQVDDGFREKMAQRAAAISRHVTKAAGSYTPAQTDHNQFWRCTGAVTLNLTAAATLTTGWCLWVRANGGAVTVDPNGAETIDGASTLSIPDGCTALINCTGSTFYTVMGGAPVSQLLQPKIAQGRLTLTSGTAITTSDVTGATTIYYTPYKGNVVWLYTSSLWSPYTFAERSLALGTISSGVNYDVFLYDNSGTLTLEAVAWSTDTARATALTTQDGVYVKSGSTNKRYVGTFRTTSTTTTEDSKAKRFVWNMDNRVQKPMSVFDATNSWVYTTATIRQANAAATNQLDFVRGIDEDGMDAMCTAQCANSIGNVAVHTGIGLDSTSAFAADSIIGAMNAITAGQNQFYGKYSGFPGLGRHFLAWLEISVATGNTTWRGDDGFASLNRNGIIGAVMC